MAGHSKWANIKFRKATQDKKRGKIFTKFIREITVAARTGGGDPNTNPRLRLVLDKAFSQNMMRDTVERAIKRGTGEIAGENVEELMYEGYGAGGVAVLVNCMTDNRNRTVSEVRHAFSKFGGRLGTDGSVSYLFKKEGVITFEPGSPEDKIMEIALEKGADDVRVNEDGSIDVITPPENFEPVKNAMQEKNLIPANAEIMMNPTTEVPLDQDTAETVLRLVDALEELDDVQDVYTNADISDEIMQKIGSH
ncbi:MAG: hypothetical protein A2X77_05400 [Gammaproteobacteria bacterium GWE2_42_36]|nr:MAG: hypothetical protein A2X77_05400 [Gammaproteobacteria bacterium GWE2_42_36]HCU05119.1 YebC/PmpR family DNA-binding transcriptional regulator [Coxiellaceae bacterium]